MKRFSGILVGVFFLLAVQQAFAASGFVREQGGAGRQLVLLRHGESVWNKEERFTGWSETALTEKGVAGALQAGELMKKEGFAFDAAYVSYLSRAIKTAWLVLESMDAMWIPVHKDWRLNERCYGDLEGKIRADVEAVSGKEQTRLWRRGFDVPPPPLAYDDPRSPTKDPRYRAVPRDKLPQAESLKDTIARTRPYWRKVLIPAIRSGKNILVVGHNTSLRALSKCIDDSLDEKALEKLEIPNTTPIVYTLDTNMKPLSRRVLSASGH